MDTSWRLFFSFSKDAFYRQVFNLTYHLKQQVVDIYAWPTRLRNKMWKLLEEQYEYERKLLESK